MEQNSFIIAAIVALLYAIGKIAEQKFLLKEEIILKNTLRDTLLVYGCVVIGGFVVSQLDDVASGKSPVSAFTGAPDF
jgi:hypothetical protein